MSIIGLFSLKGGVGKTTTAVNLAHLAAKSGQKTLLWDLDSQGASSFYLTDDPWSASSVKKLLKAEVSVLDCVQETPYPGLYLLPSRLANRKMDILFDRVKKTRKRFCKALTALKDEFALVFLDCPSSMALVSESVFQTVDYLLVPIIPTTLSLRTYESLISFFLMKGLKRELIIPFFSLVERRKRLHRETMEVLRARDERILESIVPSLSDIERMGIHKKPLFAFRRSGNAAQAYRCLWNECYERLRCCGSQVAP